MIWVHSLWMRITQQNKSTFNPRNKFLPMENYTSPSFEKAIMKNNY